MPYFVILLHEPRHDKTNKMSVRPAKTQISLGIRPVWSESSLSAWRKLGSLATHWAHNEDSDQTGLMPRLICLRWTQGYFVGFVMSRLTFQWQLFTLIKGMNFRTLIWRSCTPLSLYNSAVLLILAMRDEAVKYANTDWQATETLGLLDCHVIVCGRFVAV